MSALIRTICPGPVETSSRESCVGGFVPSFREKMRGFHDFVKQKPSFLFLELNVSGVPDDPIHMSVFVGEEAG
jgi:hypothetical protein